MTDRYAVIGNPISHSKSPQIHRMFAAQTGQDISYEAIEAPLDGFTAQVEELRNKGYKGCNVTVPFKQTVWQSLSGASMTFNVVEAQAANTLTFRNDGIHLDNTDGIGLVSDIQNNLKIGLRNKRLLLIGAGGAARGVLLPLRNAGAMVTITNRGEFKAHTLAKAFSVAGCTYEELAGKQFDIIINATSSGINNEMPNIPADIFKTIFASSSLAYDLMYGHDTPFMKFAREHGAAIVSDGLGMLVEQAAESFSWWRGIRPQTAPVIAALRLP